MIKALIRLRGCVGWSAPLLFAIKKSQVFSCQCPYDVEAKASCPPPGYAPEFYPIKLRRPSHPQNIDQFNSKLGYEEGICLFFIQVLIEHSFSK